MVVITRTVGATGRDYATITLAEADVPTLVGSTDLVATTTQVFFDIYNDAVFDERVVIDGALTTDATYNVTYRAAAGQQFTGAVADGGVQIEPTSGTGHVFTVLDDFTVFEGLIVSQYTAGNASDECFRIGDATHTAEGTLVDRCLLQGKTNLAQCDGAYAGNWAAGSAAYPITIRNSFLINFKRAGIHAQVYSGAFAHFFDVVNNTFELNQSHVGWRAADAGASVTFRIINALSANTDTGSNRGNFVRTGASSGPVGTFGSANNRSDEGGLADDWPASDGLVYLPTVNPTPGAGIWNIRTAEGGTEQSSFDGQLQDVAANDVIGTGVGPSANSLVPTIDTYGVVRAGAVTDPGATMAAAAGPGAFTATVLEGLAATGETAAGTVVGPPVTATATEGLVATGETVAGTATPPAFSATATEGLAATGETSTGTVAGPGFNGTATEGLSSTGETVTGTSSPPTFTASALEGLAATGEDSLGTVEGADTSGTASEGLPATGETVLGTSSPPTFTASVVEGMAAMGETVTDIIPVPSPWDDLLADHILPGSFGEAMQQALLANSVTASQRIVSP